MKTCPRCPTVAETPDDVQAAFGYRINAGRRVPQSWCRRCRAGNLPVGERPFRAVLADPAWQYDRDVGRGIAEDQYPTMPTAQIARLPVPAIVDEDAVLMMWCTNPMLPDGLRVMRAWGFRYKTKLTWCKNTFGTGRWLRGQTEDLLIGVRGRAKPPLVAPSSVLHAKNEGHSRKPRPIYPIAERLGPAPRVELFARERRQGWTAWGNQLSATVETALEVAA